jgi:hypothetical protein
MLDHPQFDLILLVTGFLLPAIILLVFGWFGWFANKRPAIKESLLPARHTSGLWHLSVRLGAILWILSLAAALAGKGSGRMLLLGWGIFLFLGLFGIVVATTP